MIPYGPPPADPSRPEEHYALLSGINGASDKANGAKYERSMMDLFAAAFNTTLPLHSIGVIDLKVQEQEPGKCFAKPMQLKDGVVQKAYLYALSCFLCEEQRLHCVYLNKLQPRLWMCYENSQMRKFWQGRLGDPRFLQGAICNTVKALGDRRKSFDAHALTKLEEYFDLPETKLIARVCEWRNRDRGYVMNAIADVTERAVVPQVTPQNTVNELSSLPSRAAQRTYDSHQLPSDHEEEQPEASPPS